MLYIPVTSPSVLSSIVNLDWMSDRIDVPEAEAIKWINNIGDAEVMSSVVVLGWVHDGIKELEAKTIRELSYIDYDDSEVASSVIALGWVGDDINQFEWEAINWVNNFKDVEVASSVVALSWVQDGIEDFEVQAIEELSYIDYYDAGVALSVVRLSWIQEGISRQEVKAIEGIRHLSSKDTGEASRLVAMPFLQTLESSDVSALDSLAQLASFRESDFQRVMSHPTLRGGIYDDWAKIVATLYGVSDTNPALIDTLLDPNQFTLQERTIDLPLAGETLLAIIRTGPGAERSMELLEHAVRHSEEYMATSFPTGYVGWLVGDAVTPTFGGNNFGTHITTLPKYDVDDASDSSEFASHLVAHEVAHYYWSGNSNWIDEGTADFMASISENSRTGHPVEVTNNPCGYLRTIAELEALDVTSEDGANSAFACNYALGERLFVDLYRNLDEHSFWEGLRTLYALSQEVDEDETSEDKGVGIEHVRTAFKGRETEESVVDTIVARWYDGTEPYDTSTRDVTTPNPNFLTIGGRVHTAYLSAAEQGTPLSTISASAVDDYVWLFLSWDTFVSSTTEVPLEIVSYYEDGFEFRHESVSFTADPQYNYGYEPWKWWLQVGQSPNNPWAMGNYHVYVYNEGRKLVELEYEVTE